MRGGFCCTVPRLAGNVTDALEPRFTPESDVFDDIREAFRELLHGNVPPEGRRELIVVMKETLVRARLAMDDLRDGVEATQKRVERERADLETTRRRLGLARGVGDEETVRIAARFEAQQVERLTVLEQKLLAQESELALVDREVAEMKEQLRAALAGVGSGMRSGTVDAAADPLDDGRGGVEQQLNEMKRAERRASAAADADAALAELKKRMGR